MQNPKATGAEDAAAGPWGAPVSHAEQAQQTRSGQCRDHLHHITGHSLTASGVSAASLDSSMAPTACMEVSPVSP